MENLEEHDDDQSKPHNVSLRQTPFASFSFSFSPSLPTLPSKSPPPRKVTLIPTQASSLITTNLNLSLSFPRSLSSKSTLSATNPLHSPLSLNPRRPADPSSAAALRRATVVWFRSDLRVSDNDCLNSAHADSSSVLPVFCFDPRDFGNGKPSHAAAFLLDSVSDLRRNLRSRGSDLVVRIGKPEEVLRGLAKAVGAEAVYAHMEASHDEVKAEESVEAAMKEESVEVKFFWGSTLYHLEDLPFRLDDMPSSYGGFRERVKGLEIRKTIEGMEQMKALPSRGDVEVGEIPSLVDLGISPTAAAVTMDGRPSVTMVGGEAEALEKLKVFAAECQAQVPKGINGTNFSGKISPWLEMGCLSPRSMFDELKKTASSAISGSSNDCHGMSWLLLELLWRDFFRFTTRKYNSAMNQLNSAPTTASIGALA